MLSRVQITQAVLSAAMEVHKRLGPGRSEAAYERFLQRELHIRGVRCRRLGMPSGRMGRGDLLVAELVVVEIKSLDALHSAHLAQLAAMLRQSGLKEGLLVNFHSPVLEHQAIRRNR